MTLNNIEALFESLATRHKQVNSFYNQEKFDITAVEEVLYPTLVINATEIKLPKTPNGYSTKTFSIDLEVIDLVHKDEVNKQEVLSDCDQILNDIVIEFSTHPVYIDAGLDLIDDVTLEPLRNAYGDQISGWATNVTLEIPNKISFCGSPLIDPQGLPFLPPFVTVIDGIETVKVFPPSIYTCTPDAGFDEWMEWEFDTTISSVTPSDTVALAISTGVFDVDWTDGSPIEHLVITSITDPRLTHVFPVAGKNNVRLRGRGRCCMAG